MKELDKAITVLKRGGVVICPTDTVYGFLADAGNKKAVTKIYKIKKRPKAKPLPVFVSGIKMAKEIADIDSKREKVLKKYWPGAYTFVLPKKNGGNIALRMPKSAFLLKLMKKLGKPLAQTSANISGQEPLNSAEQIMATFGKSKLVGLIIIEDSEENEGIAMSSFPNGADNMVLHIASSKPLAGKPSKVIDLTARSLTRLR